MTITLLLSLVLVGNAFACDPMGKSGIVEENNMWIGPELSGISGIDKAEFNRVIDRVEKIYAPIVKKKWASLKVVRKWSDGTVNAYAQREFFTWKVSMFGGLARHSTVTSDGFALVLCHEMGHHLGGAPKLKALIFPLWASNEGQADYFGNLKCMRKYMEADDNVTIVSKMKIDPIARASCNGQYADAEEAAICMRSAMAGQSLSNLFQALRKLPSAPKFDTPDAGKVAKTNDKHPAPQCRMDTYYAASLCTQDHYKDVSNADPNVATCSRKRGHKKGLRPLCWYKP